MNVENNNADYLLKKYYDNYDNFITVPENISHTIQTTMYSYKKNKFNLISLIRKIIITILGILTLSGGFVFAKNYIFSKFALGKGIDTAVDNGYIYKLEQNQEIIDTKETRVSINEFLMDDTNISTNFSIEVTDELKNKIDIKKIKNIELKDLIITDENNIILYCASEKALNDFCKINNLSYKFGEFNDNYFACGINSFLNPSVEDNVINLTYNIYSGDLDNSYPKSKHLKYKFTTMKLVSNYETESNYKVLEGNWEINIDIPEKMYNRNSITYNVISCSDKNVEISTAKILDTGFEFSCMIHNIELPDNVKEFRESISKDNISNEERSEILKKYLELDVFMPPVNSDYDTFLGETIEDCTYIKNQKNEKFLISSNPGRKRKSQFINDYSDFYLYETFDLTKYDITDELYLHLVFYDKPIEITLQINN